MRNFIKIMLVAAGGIYILYRSRDQIEHLADDWVTLLGSVLVFGLLSLGVVRVLRS
jgi:uncharacterized membrane protein